MSKLTFQREWHPLTSRLSMISIGSTSRLPTGLLSFNFSCLLKPSLKWQQPYALNSRSLLPRRASFIPPRSSYTQQVKASMQESISLNSMEKTMACLYNQRRRRRESEQLSCWYEEWLSPKSQRHGTCDGVWTLIYLRSISALQHWITIYLSITLYIHH